MVLTPMAVTGEEPIGSMGTDTPLAVLSQRAAAPLRLLQAALRAGHQSADRSDPRAARHVALGEHRSAHERAGRAPRARAAHPRARPDPHERAARQDPVGRRARGRPALPLHDAARALPRRRRGARAAPRPRVALPARVAGGARGEHDARHQRPRRRRRLGADPLAARHRGGAPPSRARGPAHRGRPHRRDGRRARRLALRAAHRLRRGHGQSRTSRSRRSCARALRQPAAVGRRADGGERSTSRPSRRVCSR